MCKVFVLLHSHLLLVQVKQQATHVVSDRCSLLARAPGLPTSSLPCLTRAFSLCFSLRLSSSRLQHGHEAMSAVWGHLPTQLRPEQVWGARGEPLENLPHVQRAVPTGLRPESVWESRAHSLRRPPAQLWLEKPEVSTSGLPPSCRHWNKSLCTLFCM